MTTLARQGTADAYIDRDYVTAGTTTRETTTSPSYVSKDWAMEREFSRIWAGALARDAQAARELIVEATEHVELQHTTDLAVAAQEDLRRDAKDVLRDLAVVYGFTWIDLGRMVGVSVPAIRKWRLDGRISGENHSKLAYLSAFARLLRGRGVNAASWLSAPMVPGYTVAPKHLYTQERSAALLDLASGGQDPHQFLDAIEPRWRERFDAHGYTVTRFDDGTYGITSR